MDSQTEIVLRYIHIMYIHVCGHAMEFIRLKATMNYVNSLVMYTIIYLSEVSSSIEVIAGPLCSSSELKLE